MLPRKAISEFIGTFILVFLAVGAARVSGIPGMDFGAVSLAFGFALVAAAFTPLVSNASDSARYFSTAALISSCVFCR